MKNSILVILAISVCAGVFYITKKQAGLAIKNLENENIRLNNEMSLLYNNMGVQFDSEDSRIDLGTRVLSMDGDTLLLGDVLTKDSSTLILRYSDSFCLICVDQEISNLNQLVSEGITFNIVGLSDFKDLGKFKNFNRLKSVKFKPYNLIDELTIPLEKLQIPYAFFVGNNEPYARKVFVPSKDIPENSTRYYNIMKYSLK